jgi:cbb3-type cytochrome oxidase cytochrome c subunit
MTEDSANMPKPQWLQTEQERLTNIPVKLPVHTKPPTVVEVAMAQLKQAKEQLVQTQNLASEDVVAQQFKEEAKKRNIETVNKIIEKVKSI